MVFDMDLGYHFFLVCCVLNKDENKEQMSNNQPTSQVQVDLQWLHADLRFICQGLSLVEKIEFHQMFCKLYNCTVMLHPNEIILWFMAALQVYEPQRTTVFKHALRAIALIYIYMSWWMVLLFPFQIVIHY